MREQSPGSYDALRHAMRAPHVEPASARSVRSSGRVRRRAFTLVEMLVVITIIGVLMAMLIPAVNMAREAARRTQCLNRQKEIGLGILQYQTAKDRFMGRNFGYPVPVPVPAPVPIPPPINASWTVAVLPYIGRNDIFEDWPRIWADVGVDGPTAAPFLEIMVCPSDTEAMVLPGERPTSFAVNAGRPDYYNTRYPAPIDHKENGVFHNHFFEKEHNLAQTNMSLDFIAKHDGTSNTILLAEKLAHDFLPEEGVSRWYSPQPVVHPSLPSLDGTERNNAIVWFLTPSPSMELAQWSSSGISEEVDKDPAAKSKALMRPSSNHPGGFNMVFADGGARFISENIQYRVYTLLMTPYGAKAKEPGTKGVEADERSIMLAPWVGDILNDADLQ